jgi:hypothetical protein
MYYSYPNNYRDPIGQKLHLTGQKWPENHALIQLQFIKIFFLQSYKFSICYYFGIEQFLELF